jgi:hypothetical protein
MDCWCGPGFDGPYDWDGEENGNQIYTLTFTLDHSDFQACTDYLPQWDLSSNATLVSSTETVDIFNRQVFIAEVTDLDLYESFDATLEVGCNSCCVYSKTVEDLYVTGVGNLIGGQQTYSSISSLPPTSNQIRLFPNPAKSSFNIGFETEEEQDLTITIFDTAGQQLLESQKAAIKGDNLYPFDISPYPAGLYLVQIQTGSVVYHQKFLITKN